VGTRPAARRPETRTATKLCRDIASREEIDRGYNEASRFNGDPGRIYVAGHSAGGQQVGMLAATDWPGAYGLPEEIVRGGIPISGIFDLQPLRNSCLQPKLQLTHEVILRQSPLFNIPPSGPPLLITLGEAETAESTGNRPITSRPGGEMDSAERS